MQARPVQDDRELEQILELQRQNLARNVPPGEITSQGFVTVEHTLDALRRMHAYVMGQICVGKPWRARGVFDLLYQAHRRHLRAAYDCVATEVATRNTRSMSAHERVGFTVLERYRDATDEWALLRWDWRARP
jgi:hypothetical protein